MIKKAHIFLFTLVCINLNAQQYQEKNGLVIMEAEHTNSPYDLWVLKKDVADYKGTGHLEFTGNATGKGPATSPLEYVFKIDKGGLYQLFLRARKRITPPDAHDKSNDCYVRVIGDYLESPDAGDTHLDDAPKSALIKDTKMFGGGANAFEYAERLDLGGPKNKRHAKYVFKAGETYKLVISGRSKQFNLDRIIFTRLEDHTLEEAKSIHFTMGETTNPSYKKAKEN